MAINVGTCFVEISLDDKVYKQKLSEQLTSTEATAKGIETSWKALGAKNDATYDAMRRSYDNALTLIKNSTTSTAQDIIRAEQAKNEKITALNKQQFGEHTSLLSGLKTHYLATTAAVAVAIGAITKAWDMAKVGAAYAEQHSILDNLSIKYGTTADIIVAKMDEASEKVINKSDLMKVALGGLSKGLNPDQLIKLAEAAHVLGDAVGVSATEALNDLTSALETGRTKGLKNYLGTALDLESAFGDLVSKMTAAEKTQAMYAITMQATADIQAQQTKAIDESSDKIENVEKRFNDATLAASKFFKTLVVGLIDAPKKLSEMSSNVDLLTGETIAGTQAAIDYKDALYDEGAAAKAAVDPHLATIEALKKQLQGRKDNEKAIERQKQLLEEITEDTRKNAFEVDGIGRGVWEKDIARMQEKIDKYRAAKIDEVTITEWAVSEVAVIAEKDLEEQYKRSKELGEIAGENARKIIDAEKRKYDSIQEEQKKYREMVSAEADFAATENERAINKIISDHAEKVQKLNELQEKGNLKYQEYMFLLEKYNSNKNKAILENEIENANKIAAAKYAMIQDIAGMETQAYTLRLKQIETEKNKRIKDAGNTAEAVILAEKWAADETEKAFIRMGKSSNNFKDGVLAGLLELKEANTTWGTVAYNTTKQAFDDMGKAFGSNFRDILKGDFSNLGEAWSNFGNSMLTTFTDSLGKMAAEAAAKLITMLFQADWTKASENVLGIINGAINLWNSAFSGEYEGGYIESHAGGGYIRGQAPFPGNHPGNDRIPAMLSAGEYVMPRTAVNAQTRPILDSMRSSNGRLGYYDGGSVDVGGMGLYEEWLRQPFDPTMATAIAKNQGRHFLYGSGDAINAGEQGLIEKWAEWLWWSRRGTSDDPEAQALKESLQIYQNADYMGQLLKPDKSWRTFYRDATYEDIPEADSAHNQGARGILNAIFVAACTFIGNAIGGAAAGALGYSAGGTGATALSMAGSGAGAFSGTLAVTGGNWEAALLAGVTAAAMVGINAYFTEAGTTGSSAPYLDNGEFEAWQLSPEYTDALYSNVGNGSTPLWFENILNSAGKFVGKTAIKAAIKIAAGKAGIDGSNQGHATFSYNSTDDGGLFGMLQPLIDSIAPKQSSFEFSLGGGKGGYPAQNGLDYVPYDNFPIIAHKGERVLTAEQNKRGRGDIILNFNLHGTVIDRRALDDFAQQIYPRLKQLETWGH